MYSEPVSICPSNVQYRSRSRLLHRVVVLPTHGKVTPRELQVFDACVANGVYEGEKVNKQQQLCVAKAIVFLARSWGFAVTEMSVRRPPPKILFHAGSLNASKPMAFLAVCCKRSSFPSVSE